MSSLRGEFFFFQEIVGSSNSNNHDQDIQTTLNNKNLYKNELKMSKLLKIYCLPARNNTVFMAVKLAPPSTNFEVATRFVSYCMQKWRYQLSDSIASLFHPLMIRLGQKSPIMAKSHMLINSLLTRKCADEYFFAQIPISTTNIEIHHPSNLDPKPILKSYLAQSYTNKILGYSVLLPTNFYIAKFYFLTANFLFSYHAFRVNLSVRSFYGQRRLQQLFDRKKVVFVPSKELDDRLDNVRIENGDLDDDDVADIGKDLKVNGLLQGYRRHRMQVLVDKYDYN